MNDHHPSKFRSTLNATGTLVGPQTAMEPTSVKSATSGYIPGSNNYLTL